MERCLAGQVAARTGSQTWGVKPLFTPSEGLKLAVMWRAGWVEQNQLAEMFGCSESTMRNTIHRVKNRGRWLHRPSVK